MIRIVAVVSNIVAGSGIGTIPVTIGIQDTVSAAATTLSVDFYGCSNVEEMRVLANATITTYVNNNWTPSLQAGQTIYIQGL